MRMIKDIFIDFGKYFLLMREVFRYPQNIKLYRSMLVSEIKLLGIDSLPLVLVISIFMGAAVVVQLLLNLDSPIYPSWVYGFASRKVMVLEFSPTMIGLILAGKCGSRIASEIGTQRITEQIDALQVMGVRAESYLIMPKVIAAIIFFPVLTVFSIAIALVGGGFAGYFMGELTWVEYIDGLRAFFIPYEITYACIKTIFNAFLITSISGFRGFTVRGGSYEVGKCSTTAVVQSSMLIIVFNLVQTKLLL